MRFFPDSMQRERSRRFDVIRTAVCEVLAEPLIQQGLGQLATDLAVANERSILPNVRHGEVVVPRRYRDSNRIILFPRLDDRVLIPHRSLLEPLSEVREHAMHSLDASGHSKPGGRNTKRIINDAVNSHPHLNRNIGLGPDRPQTYSANLEVGPLIIPSRPIIFIPPNLPHGDRVLDANLGVHELTHGVDFSKELEATDDIYYNISRLELRAYTAAGVVTDWAVSCGRINDELAEKELRMNIFVSELCENYELTPEAVLDPSFVFDDELGPLAFDLLMHGLVDLGAGE